jgi:hypothetical protein
MSSLRNSAILGLAILAFFFLLPLASAHQPRLVVGADIHTENSSLFIEEPTVSKAYYGELAGKPDYFKLVLDKPESVYFGILVPDVPGDNRTAISVEVYDYKDNMSRTQVLLLDGTASGWQLFYDQFGGDWYIAGPSASVNLTNVTYYIRVFSPTNQGKYTLTIGDVESFPLQEILNAYILLPIIKQEIFGKPVTFAFFQYFGIALAFGGTLMVAALIYSGKRNIQRAAWACRRFSYMIWLGYLITAGVLLISAFYNPFNLLDQLRSAIFILLLILFGLAGGKIRRMETDREARPPKWNLALSILLWLYFLFLTVAVA